MAESTSDPLEINGLEDSNCLNEIVDMLMTRASAVGVSLTGHKEYAFDYQCTQLDKLMYIRNAVLNLASNFINMDYPYWDYCWSKFPQFYSADYINRDEEHNLNILPTHFSSFDNESVRLYHKFLDNVVYWIRKFRYARARKSWRTKQFNLRCSYDKQLFYYQSSGTPVYSWGSYYYDQDGHAVYVEDDSFTPTDVWQYATGYVYRDTPSITNDGSFSVQIWDYHHLNKAFVVPGRYADMPLQNVDPYRQNNGREMSYIPEDLVTRNPSCYVAEVLWFIVPNPTSYKKELNEDVVTEVEQSQYHTWGSQSQFGAWSYNATEGTHEQTEYRIRRNDYKEVDYQFRNESSKRHRVTNWSDDGTRSAVISDTTESASHYYPSSQEDRTISQVEFPYPSLVPFNSTSRPCFSAGMIEPHGSVSYHVCDQSSVLLPSWTPPTPHYVDNNYCFGVNEWASLEYYGHTRWVPIFDFGDYLTEMPVSE